MPDLKYNITVIGCAMNKSDSERVAGYLEELGFSEADSYKSADLAVVTTCGVRQSPEDRIYGLVSAMKKANPKIRVLITGCLSQEKIVQDRLVGKVDIWMPIVELPHLEGRLREYPEFASLAADSELSDNSYLSLYPKYKSDFTAFVPIGNGCDNFCSYCYVPYARGRETYRKADEIIAEVSGLISRGYKEIVLIAQNVNSYRDGKLDFAYLIKAVDALEGDFWIRFSTSHPKDMSEELIKVIAGSAKLCRYVHLPVQAGDDEVLRKMNRHYTQDHYLKLIHKIRYEFDEKKHIRGKSPKAMELAWIPPVAITTDVIVGFPGETVEQFERSRSLFYEAKFDMAYVSQYSPRSKTASSKMVDDVPRDEKKRREKVLMEILDETSFENNKKYIGKVIRALLEGSGKKGISIARTETNKVVKIEGASIEIGSFCWIKITDADTYGLKGIILAAEEVGE